MKPEGCEAQTLRALASMPFLDRTEMVAVTGWSKAAVHEAVDRLDSGGFCAAVPHATTLFVNYRLEMRQKLQVKIEPPVSCSATLSVVNGQRSRQRGWLSPASSGVAPSCCSEGNNPACRFSLSR